MSVIGIDFGNESCYVAAAKAGGIETLANDYSLRATPSCVAFAGKKRILGVAAKNQQVTNMKNTISGFKRLLGRKFYDSHVNHELSIIPHKTEKQQDGSVGYCVNYLDEEHVFTAVQITAMLFTKLKESSVNALQAQVNDCVITCPVYYTNAERKALLDAATIAGLNVLRLMNETTATALSYGFYKQDLPEEKPRIVIFVDCGHASLQVSACAFTKGKLKMLASTWDQIGGRDFDLVLAEYFAKNFHDKYKIDAKTNARAWLRLLAEVEKIKKQMSANSTKLPLNIECFMNEIDVSSTCQRSIMEELSQHLLKRVDVTLRKCLTESKLRLDDIHSVEVVGGTSRIPAIKALIEQVFNKPASTTLNQDESVSRGAALQCAIMSPAVRVREFGVTDIQPYPVKVLWDADTGAHSGEMEVFPLFHSAPFSRVLTLFRREPFRMQVLYDGEVPYPDLSIGDWRIPDIRPTDKGEPQEIKVKIRINHHGIVLISSASLIEKKELEEVPADAERDGDTAPQVPAPQPPAGEAMDVSPEACNDNDEEFDGTYKYGSIDSPTASSPGGQGWAQRVKGWFTSGTDKKKKPSKATIDLPLELLTYGYETADINILVNHEAEMIANDEKEKERVDARNALEEYVYDMRDKLQEDGSLARYLTEKDRSSLCVHLNDLENWLYEEGENCDGETYKEKLSSLHTQTDPIKNRCFEYESIPQAFEQLGQAVQLAMKAVIEYRRGSAKYDHLTETEILNVSESAEKAKKWLDEAIAKIARSGITTDPPVKVNDVRHEWQILNTLVSSVINRPKPKPPAAPTATTKPTSDQSQNQNGEANNTDKNDSEDPKSKSNHIPEDSTMEVE